MVERSVTVGYRCRKFDGGVSVFNGEGSGIVNCQTLNQSYARPFILCAHHSFPDQAEMLETQRACNLCHVC